MFIISESGERLIRCDHIDGFEFINVRRPRDDTPPVNTMEEAEKVVPLETFVCAVVGQRNLPLCIVETKEEAIAVCKELAMALMMGYSPDTY